MPSEMCETEFSAICYYFKVLKKPQTEPLHSV